jgi:hypothetical protein
LGFLSAAAAASAASAAAAAAANSVLWWEDTSSSGGQVSGVGWESTDLPFAGLDTTRSPASVEEIRVCVVFVVVVGQRGEWK